MADLTFAPAQMLFEFGITAPRLGGGKRTFGITRMETEWSMAAVSPSTDTTWTAVLLDRTTGHRLCQVPALAVDKIEETLNAAEKVTLKLPVGGDPEGSLAYSHIAGHDYPELQLWRGNHLWSWAVITDDDGNPNLATVQAQGALWYFDRRMFGAVPRTNLLDNGDFSQGWDNWWLLRTELIGGLFPGWATVGPTDFTISPTPHLPGTNQSGQLYSTTDDFDSFILAVQLATVTAPGQQGDPNAPGLTCSMTGWVWLDPGFQIEDTVEETLMLIASYPTDHTGFPDAFYTDPINVGRYDWDPTFPTGQWVRVLTEVTIPAGETQVIVGRISVPNGAPFHFAECELLIDGATNYTQADAAQVACDNIEYAQTAPTKQNLGINAIPTPTGILITRSYPDSQHDVIGRINTEMCSDGYGDQWISATAIQRTYQFAPRKGAYKPSMRLISTGDAGSNCTITARPWAGSSGATEIIAQGSGSSFDRDERSATAPDVLLLEDLLTAPPELDTGTLEARAVEELRILSNPTTLTVVCPTGAVQTAGLVIGDSTDVQDISTTVMADGSTLTVVNASGRYRVTGKSTSPKDDQATFTMTAWAEP